MHLEPSSTGIILEGHVVMEDIESYAQAICLMFVNMFKNRQMLLTSLQSANLCDMGTLFLSLKNNNSLKEATLHKVSGLVLLIYCETATVTQVKL